MTNKNLYNSEQVLKAVKYYCDFIVADIEFRTLEHHFPLSNSLRNRLLKKREKFREKYELKIPEEIRNKILYKGNFYKFIIGKGCEMGEEINKYFEERK